MLIYYALILDYILKKCNDLIKNIQKEVNTMSGEQQLMKTAEELKMEFKIALLKRHMTQKEIGKMLGVKEPQISRAIAGESSPKSRQLRAQMKRILDID